MRRLSVCQQLAMSFGVVLILTGLLTWSSLDTIRRLGGMLGTAVNEDARVADLIGSVKLKLHEMKELSTATQFSYSVSHVVKVKETKTTEGLGECSTCHAFGAAEDHRQDFAKLAAAASKDADELQPLLHSDRSRRAAQTIRGAIDEWHQRFDQYLVLVSKGDFAAGHGLVTDRMVPLLEQVDKAAGELEAEQQELRASSKTLAASNVARSRWTTACTTGRQPWRVRCFLVLAIRQINRLLRQFAGELSEGSRRVMVDAEKVRQASRAVEQGASEQAASIEETSATSEQVNATANQNAAHSAETSQLIQQVHGEMQQTNAELQQMREAMNAIGESSEQISKIIKTIDEIAFQTNLLALNAAVEAARAGTAGMGFAVVADEVRALAQRASGAAKETADLIGESIHRSQQGKTRLDELTQHIRSIAQGTESVTALADQVQSGSREQAQALQEIGSAMARMRSVTEKTTANAGESAEVGERLSAESQALEDVVQRLEEMVNCRRDR